ncbi:MAG: hypothetical protein GC191_20580 [Azospirillum sp.]|nr:hypothetical protein [Azospirillum sp.]
MMQLSDIASRVQRALRPVGQDLTYRVTTSFAPKAAATVSAGASSITLGTLPAGMTGVMANDTFGAGVYRITADVPAISGTIVASFTPPLVSQISSGATVTVIRYTDSPCLGFVEWLDTSSELAPGISVKDGRITVLADSLPLTPKALDTVIVDGKPRSIKNAARDPASAMWVLLVSG